MRSLNVILPHWWQGKPLPCQIQIHTSAPYWIIIRKYSICKHASKAILIILPVDLFHGTHIDMKSQLNTGVINKMN